MFRLLRQQSFYETSCAAKYHVNAAKYHVTAAKYHVKKVEKLLLGFCAVVRALASHHCGRVRFQDPGSTVFLPLQKPTLQILI